MSIGVAFGRMLRVEEVALEEGATTYFAGAVSRTLYGTMEFLLLRS